MSSIPVTRFSDAILLEVNAQDVEDIIAGVTQPAGQARDMSLVMSGIALGADESNMFIAQQQMSFVSMMREAVARFDSALATMPPGEALNAIADARSPVAEFFNKHTALLADAMVRNTASVVGIPEDLIRGEKSLDDLPLKTQKAMGIKIWSGSVGSILVLGWYAARKTKKLDRVTCPCPGCFGKVLNTYPGDANGLFEQMLDEFEGLDMALVEFLRYYVSSARKNIQQDFAGVNSITATDAEQANEEFHLMMMGIKSKKPEEPKE